MDQEWLPNCDREVFARVWKRVMPDRREDCPFEVVEAAQQSLPAVVVPDPPAAEEEEPQKEEKGQFLMKELKELDPDSLTPMQALMLLNEWKKKAEE